MPSKSYIDRDILIPPPPPTITPEMLRKPSHFTDAEERMEDARAARNYSPTHRLIEGRFFSNVNRVRRECGE